MQINNRFSPFIPVMIFACVLLSSHAAWATQTGISAIDNETPITLTILKGMAGIGAIATISLAIWEFVMHRQVMKSVIEFVLGIIMGVFAVNAQQIANALGIGGTLIR